IYNIAKHANAKRVQINVTDNQDLFALSIIDDGIGFIPEDQHQGNGILSMRKRAEEINATFEIHSTLKKGTQVILKYPL
ncbi:MAG: ATP-binding protein, partial [Bacteroidota bacterium]